MIETTPFLAIIFTLIITNLLCAAIDVVSHYIRKETQQIIARLIVGVIFSVVTPLILGVWIEFNFPIILAFEHIIQITGPIIEEVIFRGAFVPFLMHNGCGSIFTFFYCSALFGMAHIHHLFFFKRFIKT
ncbi:intramembrane prenyl-peptidase Rce1 [Entamoeba marina]